MEEYVVKLLIQRHLNKMTDQNALSAISELINVKKWAIIVKV